MTLATRHPCDETALLRPGPVAAPCSAATRRWVLVAAILGSSLAFVDGTVVNVALPAIQRTLGASVAQAQWVVEAYALLLAALLLVGGALGDRLGRRRVFLAGVALFSLASAACALAPTVHLLIAARAAQGVGAALLVPGSLALISASFPEAERGRAFGTWAGASGIASALGPLLGGWLIDHASWHWAFAVNLPVAAAVAWITWARVPADAPQAAAAPLDVAGALLATLGLAGLVFAFIEAPGAGWTAVPVLLALALGVLALAAFVPAERRHATPMLPLDLLRNRAFTGANLLTLLLYAALGGGLFFLPLNLIQVQQLSALAAGAALLPFVLLMSLLSRRVGALVDRHGARPLLLAGPAVAAGGFALLALPGVASSYWSGFLPGIAVLGLGMALTVAPLTTSVMAAVEPGAAGTASGVNNAVSRVAGVLAIAVFGWLMASVFEPRLAQALQAAQLPAGAADAVWAQRGRLAAIVPPPGLDRQAADAVLQATREAFVAGFRWIMLLSAGLALAGSLVAWLTLRRPPTSGRPPPT